MQKPHVVPLKVASATLDARTDDELMLLAKAGSRDAFGVLAGRYTDRVLRFSARQTGDKAAAEEIAQEVWLYLWSMRATYVPQGKFVVLLFTAVRHRSANHRRGARRRATWIAPTIDTHLPDLAGAHQPDDLDLLLEEERQRRVVSALQKLPPKVREALLLRFGEGLSYQQMADVLSAGESTIRSRVYHALKNLRALLGETS